MFEGSPKLDGDLELSTQLSGLEKRRDDLIVWMEADSTPEDARLLDQLNLQIKDLKEKLGIKE